MITRCTRSELNLDFSFGAGLTADRADHLTAVHLDHVIIDTQHALVPGADVDVIINTRLHMLKVHDLIPDCGKKEMAQRKIFHHC